MSEALKRAAAAWAADLAVVAGNLTDARGMDTEECACVVADTACDIRGAILAYGGLKPAPDPGDTPVCPHCGSPDVTQDATAACNPDSGKWELAGLNDAVYCNGPCGAEIRDVTTRHQYDALRKESA